jgi:hypothetical protein
MQTLTRQRKVALGTLGFVVAALLGTPAITPVQAKSKTWKKVAIGAGAVTAYGLVKHNGKIATIGGLATAGSYLKYRHDKKKEDASARRRTYYRRTQRRHVSYRH